MAEKTKKKKHVTATIIFFIALAVFIFAAAMLGRNYIRGMVTQHEFKQLQVDGKHDLAALHRKNGDVTGWIKVKGTSIDYPVMQTVDDPEYYLRRNFNREHSVAGTPFLDAASRVGRSQNYLIYGHNMKNGTMFHDLLKYEKEAFYRKHKTFTYDEYRDGRQVDGTYEVVAVVRTQIYSAGSGHFRYNHYADIETRKSFNTYIKNIKALSEISTGVTPQYGDQLVTLSTCAYHVENGRFFVVGRKVK
ncbi:MAG: class B sortase [Anaerovoracaceae bacterium]|jgi:sortase B